MRPIKDILKTMEYGPSPEANGDVNLWLEQHGRSFGHYINGAFVKPEGRKAIAVANPANGDKLAEITCGNADDVDQAVKAARAAFGKWSKLSGYERAKYLYAIARHIQKRERFLAVLETMDNGKPIRETRDIDIPLAARHFYHHAGWTEMVEDEFKGFSPVGVCGQVIPWNFPLLMLAWKIAPALAAGNTVVLKPADLTPLSAIAFAEICHEVGLPAGVVNIVQGDGTTGAAICGHDGVDKVAFTGSTQVGRVIREQIAGSGKKLSLELGGKSPFIVFEDADLDAAVEGVVDAIWFNQGEVCCAGSRLLVQEGIADRFYAKLKKRLETLRVGDPLDKSTDVGAIVSPGQVKRISDLIQKGIEEGGELWQTPNPLPAKGNYIAPGFFTEVDQASTVCQVEIFGPIAAATTFRTPDEAVSLANNTRYGLAASIWSENINVALDLAARVKAGVVWINCTNMLDAGAGFGGYRESGFGREGAREGMYEYLVSDWEKALSPAKVAEAFVPSASPASNDKAAIDGINRTMKNYIGGKQARPDGGYSYSVIGKGGAVIGQAGIGNRKDIRNAVEAATKAGSWGAATAHNRAQVLYYLGENLDARRADFVARLMESTGVNEKKAEEEFETALRRIFYYAAQADKFDGAVHSTKSRHVTLAMNEPWGVMGIVCPDEAPLLSLVSLVLPAIAMGNRTVVVPSSRQPLIAGDFYQVLDTSDMPGGVVNIVTGERDLLTKTLAEHDDVAAVWYFGSREGSAMVEKASAGNLKATWVINGRLPNWLNKAEGQGRDYLRRAVQVKNIWVPYGA
ncbi:aldehyde dehydrogenase (NAD+) [Ochrobactrum intermedium]|uniref:Aldehyde dehydrogenase (NAD+) n=2 Tax=Brucella intermedia TaxID=94625 RepID=A0ABR6ALX9_9HYPH|nr:aldehyde dehydrogenase family protein [Brucella intermedia]MBA8850281.1 aldehyde dehydrogenase (NAD+) [Brucella intermedia]MDH0124142.1 aldehyde dehydrogenase family protein [Brucella intermedia GD04153]MDL2201061.1 aldehyde dehydrogenase family protein [Brucella intermedia]QNQ42143.1 aldehyde dehydrogenase family protein [Brucella intermedia]WGJ08767.1 aldehyde dehydrogenase family protein [Brucella intermedia]